MKKILLGLAACLLLLASCGKSPSESASKADTKQLKAEVYSAQDNTLLKTITDQELLSDLNDFSDWDGGDSPSEGLAPEYTLLVYQEKTLLAGQDPDAEREYELIETLTTYQDSRYMTAAISPDAVKSVPLPEDLLTFRCEIPKETAGRLREALSA